MWYFKPFKSKFSLYSSIIAESSFFIITFMLFFVIKPRSDSINSLISWTGIVIIIASLIISWILVGIQQFQTWRAKKQPKVNKIKICIPKRISKNRETRSKKKKNFNKKYESERDEKNDTEILDKKVVDKKKNEQSDDKAQTLLPDKKYNKME